MYICTVNATIVGPLGLQNDVSEFCEAKNLRPDEKDVWSFYEKDYTPRTGE